MIEISDNTYMGAAQPESGGGGGSGGETAWGDITGTLSNQTDLQDALDAKQGTLTAGSNISISNGTISATDTTYSAFTGATSQAAGAAGLVPAPTTTDVDKYLKGDGTWGAVSGGGIQNTATSTDSLTILGTPATYDMSTNIGVDSSVGSYGAVAIGYGAYSDDWGVSIGGYNNDGSNSTYAYSQCVAIGCDAIAGSQNGQNSAVAIGSTAVAPSGSVAINGACNSDNSVAINGYCSSSDQIVIGLQGGSNTGSYGLITLGSNYIESGYYNNIIGCENDVDGNHNTIMGYGWKVNSTSCILLGAADPYEETLTENKVFYVSFQTESGDPGTFVRYKMLDGSTGKIPNDRINADNTPTQGSSNMITSGAVYTVLGDIETLLAQV
jgi:hypothetical protein